MRLGSIFFPIAEWLPSEWPELDDEAMKKAVDIIRSAPKDWRQFDPPSTILTQRDQDRISLLRAACCLFWHQFYKGTLLSAELLEELRAAWRVEHTPDAQIDWVRAYISIHITGAVALHFNKVEDGYSEALEETVDEITRLASRMYAENDIMEPDVYYQSSPLYYNESVPLKRSLSIAISLAWCLKFYINKSARRYEDAFDCAYRAFEQVDIIGRASRFLDESYAVIEQENVVSGLTAVWIRGQEIVEVFGRIHGSVDPKINWAILAERCEDMRFHYEQGYAWAETNRFVVDNYVRSNIGKIQTSSGSEWTPSYPLSEFWTFARGLCITRLSPDAYMKLRQEEEKHAAEQRLRTYFFQDTWNGLPEASKDNLITADRTYWAHEGNRGSIAGNLRLTLEPILEKHLMEPYRRWQEQTGTKSVRKPRQNESDPFMPISLILREWRDDPQTFRRFTKEVFGGVPEAFWKRLRDSLYVLRDLRSAVEHPENTSQPTENEISRCYRLCVGIGEKGLISEILLLADSGKQPTERP